MSKRKFELTDEDEIDQSEWVNNKFSKDDDNSEESDEEEEGDGTNYNILSQDDIEGQEESGLTYDDGVQITPFNMDEELEEGHFDTDGMYHWKKENMIRDNWLDSVHGVQVKPRTDKKVDSDSEPDDDIVFDALPLYKEMLQYMNEGETVSGALRRHGGTKSLSASERLKLKKLGKEAPKEKCGDNVSFTRLTELANTILSRTGNMDIYQQTYNDIADFIGKSEKKKQSTDVNCTKDDLDMYSDDFDSKEKARINTEEKTSSNSIENSEKEPQWEYKTDRDSEKTEGPYSTTQMIKWKREGHFKKKIWVRKYDSNGEFYAIDRIDFELYV